VLGQALKVTKRAQPQGEQGVRFSLEEVARRIALGGVHPKVVAWAGEQLTRARKLDGIACNNDRDRARVLLKAVQKKLWKPDPVGSEFMVGAHLMACDRSTKDEICFLSMDCDDLVVLLGSCFLSAGLHTMVVGHAYNSAKNISHVLTAVRVDGKWLYADPTPDDFKLGECVDFSRERILSVPNVQVLCDGDSCLADKSNYDPNASNFVVEGTFVGVDGMPRFAWLRKQSTLGQQDTLGQQSTEDQVYNGAYNEANKEVDRQAATKNYDAKKIATAAGAGAAAAGCAAAGAAVASPFCAAIGAKVGEWIASVFESTPLNQGIAGKLVQVQTVRVIRKELAGDDWSRAQAEAYLNKLGAPCGALQQRILDNGGRSGDDFKPVGDCILKQEAKMIAEFSAVGASRAALGAPRPKKSKVVPVLAVGAAGAAVWYFWSDIARFFR
jgi:hypothetical protein